LRIFSRSVFILSGAVALVGALYALSFVFSTRQEPEDRLAMIATFIVLLLLGGLLTWAAVVFSSMPLQSRLSFSVVAAGALVLIGATVVALVMAFTSSSWLRFSLFVCSGFCVVAGCHSLAATVFLRATWRRPGGTTAGNNGGCLTN
jgi:hypothetical protein